MGDPFPTMTTDFLTGRKDLRDVDVASQWRYLLSEEEMARAVRYCAKKIDEKFEGEDIVVVCILKGCVYFFVDLTRAMKIPYSTYFLEASSYHDSQTQAETVELLSVLVPSKFEGKKVVLLDELYDTGATLQQVKEKLMEQLNKKAEDIFTCTLFLKQKGALSPYPLPDLYALELPDVWVVGYGLDDAQEKRGWTHLYAVPKIPEIPLTADDAMFSSEEAYQKSLDALRTQVRALPVPE